MVSFLFLLFTPDIFCFCFNRKERLMVSCHVPWSVCLSVYLSVHPSVCLFSGLSVHLSVCLSVCPSIHLCLSVCQSVYPSICLSVCLSIHLSVYLWQEDFCSAQAIFSNFCFQKKKFFFLLHFFTFCFLKPFLDVS